MLRLHLENFLQSVGLWIRGTIPPWLPKKKTIAITA